VRTANGCPGEILEVAPERAAGGIAVWAAPVTRSGFRRLGGVHARISRSLAGRIVRLSALSGSTGLADLSAEDLASIVSENEALFVEHEGGFERRRPRVLCSCANALGGWVVIGVTNGVANEGEPVGWRPVRAARMMDRVRECLKAHAARGSPPDRGTQMGVPTDAPGVILGDLRDLQ
jgi:hypothetical protein